jgi:hypothetical protein
LPNPSCSASYTQIQFPGTGYGFEATVDVTNTGTTALTGWTVTFTFPGNQWILHYWHALVTQSRENITAINASDNGLLGAGETTAFGLLGDYFDAGPVSLTCTPEPWQVSLTGSSYVAPGYAGTFTATTNNDVGPTSYDIQIWDVTTGTEVALCGRGTTCSATYTTNYDAAEDQIVAYIAENSTGTVPLGTAQASSNTVLVYNDV